MNTDKPAGEDVSLEKIRYNQRFAPNFDNQIIFTKKDKHNIIDRKPAVDEENTLENINNTR